MWRVSSSPIFCQVAPPSVGLVDAVAPGGTLAIVGLAGAHPDHRGVEGATATAPMDIMPPASSKTGVKETPSLALLKTPPVVVAM